MIHFEDHNVTGTGSVYGVLGAFACTAALEIGVPTFGSQADLGALDAPKRLAAGSTLAECWYGLDGPRTINRDAA